MQSEQLGQGSPSADAPAGVSERVETQKQFDSKMGAVYEGYGPHLRKVVRNRLAPYRDQEGDCSPKKFCSHTLHGLFPFVNIMRRYKIKRDAIKDLLAGLTVFIMGIPQGMAYGLLTGLGPVYGLYTSTFPIFFYFFLGTSRHIAMGVAAAISLIINGVLLKMTNNLPEGITVVTRAPTTGTAIGTPGTTLAGLSTDSSSAAMSVAGSSLSGLATTAPGQQAELSYMWNGEIYTRHELWIQISASLTLFVGLVQLIMGVCRLGFLTVLFSNAMVSAYTAGVAIHVASSQVPYVVGYKVKSYNGALKLVYFYRDLFMYITKFNWISFVIAVVSFILLYINKEYLQPRIYKQKRFPPIPFPMDLIVIVAGTLISYFVGLKDYGVAIVGEIPPGIPHPVVPSLFFWRTMFVDGIILAILAYSLSISLATIYAQKNGYNIDSNQELIAYGTCNLVGCWMQCFISCASVGRSAIQHNAGAKTQLVSLIHGVGMIITLLFIAPLFQPVPNCVLASIILVAVKNMVLQITELPGLWRTSLVDFSVWVFTFTATILLDADSGLLVGIAATIVTIVLRSIFASCSILGHLPQSGQYVESAFYPNALQYPGIKVFRFEGAVFFASFTYFRGKVIEKTGQDPIDLKKRIKKEAKRRAREEAGLSVPDSRLKEVVLNSPPNGMGTTSSESTTSSVRIRKVSTSKATEEYTTLERVPTGPKNASLYMNPLHAGHANNDRNNGESKIVSQLGGQFSENVHHIVLDCSAWAYLDDTGVKLLLELVKEYREVGVRVLLAECTAHVRMMLTRSDYEKQCKDPECVYPRLHDAVLAALLRHSEDKAKAKKPGDMTQLLLQPGSEQPTPPNGLAQNESSYEVPDLEGQVLNITPTSQSNRGQPLTPAGQEMVGVTMGAGAYKHFDNGRSGVVKTRV